MSADETKSNSESFLKEITKYIDSQIRVNKDLFFPNF